MALHQPTWRGRPIPLTRKAIEDEIERLIDLLDFADGNSDDEPSLAGWAATSGSDNELDGEIAGCGARGAA